MIGMHSTDLARGRNTAIFDWWPAVGWWPDAARDLLRSTLRTPDSVSASATHVLPSRTESVHAARTLTAETLNDWGLADLIDGMELVVSELTTNALRHGLALDLPRYAGPIRMSFLRRGSLVLYAIADPGSRPPVLRQPAPLEPGGLGLHIVESISLRWGWSPLAPQGKAVWAVLQA